MKIKTSSPGTVAVNRFAATETPVTDAVEYARESARITMIGAIAEAMREKGISQAKLASIIGKTKAHVSKILSGQNITMRTVGELLYGCGLEIDDVELRGFGISFVPVGAISTEILASTNGVIASVPVQVDQAFTDRYETIAKHEILTAKGASSRTEFPIAA